MGCSRRCCGGCRGRGGREGRGEEHESYIPAPGKFSRAANMQARMAALEKQAMVQAEFEKSFSRDELKLIAAQAFYSERVAVAKDRGTLHGSSTPAILIAAWAAVPHDAHDANDAHDAHLCHTIHTMHMMQMMHMMHTCAT